MKKGDSRVEAFQRMKSVVLAMWEDIHVHKKETCDSISVALYSKIYHVGAFRKEFVEDILMCDVPPTDKQIEMVRRKASDAVKDSKKRCKVRNYKMHTKGMEKKVCTNCGRELPIIEFYSKNGVAGGQSHCKECVKAHGRLRNGTTGVYREPVPILFSDLELMDEAKKRGLLTTDLAIQILKDNGIKGELHQTMTYTL